MRLLSDQTPASTCAACGYVFDQATDLTGGCRPREGNISVCLRCGHLGVFQADLSVRPLTADEVAALPPDLLLELGRIERARQAVLAAAEPGEPA